MPILGEIQRGFELGYKNNNRHIWHACEGCGRESWVQLRKGQLISQRCRSCAGKKASPHNSGAKHNRWKGGRIFTGERYIQVWLQPDDFFYPMADKGHYVLEHRLVIAKALGRCLHSWEIVHHLGTKYPKGSIENRSDNRIENLQLVQEMQHKQITILENKINQLQMRVTQLEAEVVLLKAGEVIAHI